MESGRESSARGEGFYKHGRWWYFGRGRVASFGPFDRVVEIVMSEWTCEQKEVTGTAIAELLRGCDDESCG